MKKVILTLGLLAVVTSTSVMQSCNLKEKVIQNLIENFDFDGAVATFEVPVITDTVNTQNGDTTMVDLNLNSMISQYAASMGLDDVKSITVKECILTVTNPTTNNDASNFKSMTASVYSDVNATPVTMSNNGDIPNTAGATTVTLTPATVNLADYMKTGTKLYYYASVKLRKPTTQVLICTMRVKYNVSFK